MSSQNQENARQLHLESDALRVTIEPRAGGKIRSFYSKRSEFEFLYQDQREHLGGTDYGDHDVSGMDECFPTVVPCNYPDGLWKGLPLGDHGLLWKSSWEFEVRSDKIITAMSLEELPIRFTRTAELTAPETLLLNYSIENRATEPIEYLYAAHLLLFADQDTTIAYPAEMDEVYGAVILDNPVLKQGEWNAWPPSETALVHEPLVPSRNTFAKLYSPKLQSGQAIVSHRQQAEQLHIEFDTQHLPHLGILLSLGFGLNGRDGKSLLFGLEPTSGIGDDLPMCRTTKSSQRIAAGESLEFWLRISLVSSDPSNG